MSSIGSGGVVFGVQCAGAIGSSQSAGEGGGPSVDHCRPFSAQTEPEKWLETGRGQRGWEGAATGAVCQLIPEKPCW